MTNEQFHKSVFLLIQEKAVRSLLAVGPCIALLTTGGERMFCRGCPPEEFPIFARELIAERLAVNVAYISEAWAAQVSKEDAYDHTVVVSEREDKFDVIIITVIDATSQGMASHRVDGDNVLEAELQYDIQGRMVAWFSQADYIVPPQQTVH